MGELVTLTLPWWFFVVFAAWVASLCLACYFGGCVKGSQDWRLVMAAAGGELTAHTQILRLIAGRIGLVNARPEGEETTDGD